MTPQTLDAVFSVVMDEICGCIFGYPYASEDCPHRKIAQRIAQRIRALIECQPSALDPVGTNRRAQAEALRSALMDEAIRGGSPIEVSGRMIALVDHYLSTVAAPDPVASPNDDWVICQNCEGDGGWPTSAAPHPLDHGYSPRPKWAGTCPRCGAKAGDNCAVLSDPVASPAPLDVERLAKAMHRAYAEMRAGRVRFPSPEHYRVEAKLILAVLEDQPAGEGIGADQPPAEALRLLRAAIGIIEAADHRASAADGPVGHVRDEMTDAEWRVMYEALTQARRYLAATEETP